MAVDLNDIEKMEIKNVNSGKVSLFTNKTLSMFRVSLRKTNRDLGYIISVSRTPKSPNPTSINLWRIWFNGMD